MSDDLKNRAGDTPQNPAEFYKSYRRFRHIKKVEDIGFLYLQLNTNLSK
jgi:hypothetical protein